MSLKNELDRVLGPTPPAFSKRVDETLRTLKEDDKMKMAHMRRIVCVVIIAVVLLGAAVALIATQGQDWYYHSRFTGYQENEPEKQQAILDHLSTDIPQEQSDAGIASVVVQDASWAPENGVATLSCPLRRRIRITTSCIPSIIWTKTVPSPIRRIRRTRTAEPTTGSGRARDTGFLPKPCKTPPSA